MATVTASHPLQTRSPAASAEASQRKGYNLPWLDALKGIAILAVVLDHSFIVDDYVLWKHLYFSVSWFIFLAGVSNTYTARLREFEPRRDCVAYWRHRLNGLLWPYLCVSVVAYLLVDARIWTGGRYLRELLLFHTLPPLYFIALLLQMLAIFPLLFALIYRWGWKGRLALALAIVPVATRLSSDVTFPWVLGAHYLFGASFLYLFVLGMLLQPQLTSSRLHPVVWLALGVPIFVWFEHLNLDSKGVLMTHPPSNVLVAYSVGLLLICYAAARLFGDWSGLRWLRGLGRRSLDIFLYHYIFVLPILPYHHGVHIGALSTVQSQLLLMAADVPFAIVGSLLLGPAVAAVRAQLAALASGLLQRADLLPGRLATTRQTRLE